jgi:hypothetical protein
MRNPSSICAKEHREVWDGFLLRRPLRLVTVLRVVLFQGSRSGKRVTDTLVARGCARLAAQESHGCQRNGVQNTSSSYLDLSATVYGSRPLDRRDRP